MRIFAILFFIFLYNSVHAQSYCVKAQRILDTVKKYHYQPKPIDSTYSILVFEEFIDLLDPNGLYLTGKDMEMLEFYQFTLGSSLENKECEFLAKATEIYDQRLQAVQSYLRLIRESDLNFKSGETLTLTEEVLRINGREFENRWMKDIKYQVLSSYVNKRDSIDLLPPFSDFYIEDQKKKIIDDELCIIEAKYNHHLGLEGYIGERFLNAVTFGFDPHTVYLSAEARKELEQMISTETDSFGIEVSKSDQGEIIVENIIPGSNAWSSNQINEGDIIEGVKVENMNYKMFTNCLSLNEVNKYITGIESTAMFRIRKKSGETVEMNLTKGKIDIEENVVSSYILDGEKKIGYINLPIFYTNFEYLNSGTDGSASDVAREMIRLKREGIEGLIFDLRDNGGGSMEEALNMAGIFINYGALCIVDSRGDEPSTNKDNNRGKIYDGPLVLLISSLSASASELFAAAMQDQNRAVIVGSTSFGKSTYQSIIPVEGIENGSLKITLGKFFRVTGGSHQKIGIKPDIDLPEPFKFEGERGYKSALNPSTVNKKAYYFPEDSLPINELINLSKQRITEEKSFQNVDELAQFFEDFKKEIIIPLDLNSYINFITELPISDLDKLAREDSTSYQVGNPKYSQAFISIHPARIAANKEAIKNISTDIYIREAYFITKDLIGLKERK